MHPDFTAKQSEWQRWADERYPYDGSDPRRATGFNLLRTVNDRCLAADMALALCRALPPKKPDPVDSIPPPIDFGYGNQPPPRREPEQQTIGDWAREA